MHMQALAMAAGGSVTVLSHPSLQGIASGSGISGSTAWHGAFRFRQYLTGIKPESGDQPDNDLRQLEFKKNQYGPIGETIILHYRNGLFLPVLGPSSLEAAAADQAADELFLRLLARFADQGRNLSHSTHPRITRRVYSPTSRKQRMGGRTKVRRPVRKSSEAPTELMYLRACVETDGRT